MISHVVGPGECLASIAAGYGFTDLRVIYDQPENADLRRSRPDPKVLLAGDVVAIPDPQLREVTRPTEQRHQVVVNSRPTQLRLRLLNGQRQPRTGLPFTVEFQDQKREGTTDGDGLLVATIPSWLTTARVLISDHGQEEELCVALGYLDPVSTPDGVRQRLGNLGYGCTIPGLPADIALRHAVSRFQRDSGLTVTGTLDDATRARLSEAHGS